MRRTHTTVFIVVEAATTYNVILGMPMMSLFKEVALTYHQKVKFPMGGRVGELREDQTAIRKYYVEMVRTDLKQARVGGDMWGH